MILVCTVASGSKQEQTMCVDVLWILTPDAGSTPATSTGFDGGNKQRLHAEVRVARKTIRDALSADNYNYALAA